MALHSIKEFDPNHRDHFDHQDIQSFGVYSGDEQIGSIDDLLVDDDGSFRYFVVHTSGWILGKKVLLPIARTRIDDAARHVYVDQFSKAQLEALPAFTHNTAIDFDHEEQTRQVYRTADVPAAYGVGYAGSASAPPTPVDPPPSYGVAYAGYDTAPGAPSEAPAGYGVGYTGYDSAPATPTDAPPSYGVGHAGYDASADASSQRSELAADRNTYSYQQDPALYALNERDHQTLKRYEERLMANKQR